MATEILRPDAGGDETNLSYNLGQGVKGPNPVKNFDCVNEEIADEGATIVLTSGTVFLRDLYNLTDSSGSGTINKITVYARFMIGSGA